VPFIPVIAACRNFGITVTNPLPAQIANSSMSGFGGALRAAGAFNFGWHNV